MNPSSVAIVGASNNPMKMGTMHALSILKDGFQGKFFPVHPTEEMVLGHKAYKSPLDLPEVPDLAMFVLPARYLLKVFDEFGRIGTKYAIVITAGFKEAGDAGIALESELKALAEKHHIRFVGPNCMGIVNRDINLNTSVSPITGPAGPLGLISQSGTYVAQTVDYLKKRGIRLGKAVSLGNEADVNIIDALEYMGADPNTTAIAMYIEAVRDVRRFLAAARKITPHKPVIAQYIGGSEAGGRAGLSHTGAMAGKDFLYDGLFRQAGIIRVHSVEDLYGIGWALATQPRIRGNRIGIITNSGGPGSAIADTLDSLGGDVPLFSQELKNKIKPLIPEHAPCGNPVDLTFALDMDVMTRDIPDLVMNSGEVDGIIMHGAMSTGWIKTVFPHLKDLMPETRLEDLVGKMTKDITESVRMPFKNHMPMTVSAFFDRSDHYTKAYEDNNVPVFDAPEKAARAMATLIKYKGVQDRGPAELFSEIPANDHAVEILARAAAEGRKSLDEVEAKQILAAYGVPVPVERLCYTADQVAQAAADIGFPVVIKACDPAILHKTDQGLVHVNIRDARAAAACFDAVLQAAGRSVPVLVAQMIQGQREFLAGITWDALFGHCVAFGVGGIFTEALNDITYRVAPLSTADAREMISDLRSQKLLAAYRGMPAMDLEALAEILSVISRLPLIHPEIREIDINPLLCAGTVPVAVDALIVIR